MELNDSIIFQKHKLRFDNSNDQLNIEALDQLISEINVLGIRNIHSHQCSKIFSKYKLSTFYLLDELYKKVLFESIWYQTNDKLDKAKNELAYIKNKILKSSDIKIIIQIFEKLSGIKDLNESTLNSIFEEFNYQNLETKIDFSYFKYIINMKKNIFTEYYNEYIKSSKINKNFFIIVNIYKLFLNYCSEWIKNEAGSNLIYNYVDFTDIIRSNIKSCLSEILYFSYYRKNDINVWEFLESEFCSSQEFIYEAYNGCEVIIQRAIEFRNLNNIDDNLLSKIFLTYYD